MHNPPKGYWNIHQAVKWAEAVRAGHHATAEGMEAGPFGGASLGRDAAFVVREALECNELCAAGVRVADGALVTLPPSAWRALFARPDDPRAVVGHSEYFNRPNFGPPARTRNPFAEAQAGRTIPFARHWFTPILAQADLAQWAGEAPPDEPPERPGDWPAPAVRKAAIEQLEWFALGYAVRAGEGGAKVTRDEFRDAVTREGVAGHREAEDAHKNLPARFKNPDKSKGGNRQK